MKKLTFLLITFFLIYLIYNFINVNKINYVSISDSVLNSYNYYLKDNLSNKISSFNNYFMRDSIDELYKDIRDNRTIRVDNEYYYIKKVLRESDILVISIGMRELVNNFNKYGINKNYDFFNNMYNNIERMVNEIKKYAYGTIIFLGLYNPTNYYDANIDRFFYDIDIKLSKLMIDNNIIYIDLYELIKGNNFKKKNNYYLNNEGNRKITDLIEYYIN